jgi:hypothetical protein
MSAFMSPLEVAAKIKKPETNCLRPLRMMARRQQKIYRGLGRKGRAVSERGLMRRRGPIGGGTACKE